MDNYWMELGFVVVIGVFLAFYFWGKRRNEEIASEVFLEMQSILQEQFALVGNNVDINVFKESHNEFHIYGSGRKNIQSFDLFLQLLPRQDLIGFIFAKFSSLTDKITFNTQFDDNVAPFILLIARRGEEAKLREERQEIRQFTPEPPSLDEIKAETNSSSASRSSDLPPSFPPQMVSAPEHPLLLREMMKRGFGAIGDEGIHLIRFLCTDDPFHARYTVMKANESQQNPTSASSSSSSSAQDAEKENAKEGEKKDVPKPPSAFPQRLNMELTVRLPVYILHSHRTRELAKELAKQARQAKEMAKEKKEVSNEQEEKKEKTDKEQTNDAEVSSQSPAPSSSPSPSPSPNPSPSPSPSPSLLSASSKQNNGGHLVTRLASIFLSLADSIAENPLPRDITARAYANRQIAKEQLKKDEAKAKEEEEEKKKAERKRREDEKFMKLSPEEQRRREAKMAKREAKKNQVMKMKAYS
eukprot:MONOS_5533.1-p1 / transcript=MONOS_5533.1 / gene=MONOS_5533 / organism=Monocercomonoides_exilis_PA203 / gene_product=unspecified product / transcript_product=unspecified product / location=Mono_scaffold00162:53606-55189(+) / protein_length=470 / sequence_SO=supercontig / SO=protein_coding / is_pseudo=false